MADGFGLLVGVPGDDAGVQRADGGVMTNGGQGGHPQVAADQVVAAPAHDVTFRSARFAVAIDAAAHFDRHGAEVGDKLVGRLEAFDVEDEGAEDGGREVADAGDRVEIIGLGQLVIGGGQHDFQAFFAGGGVAELADLIAHQVGDGGGGQGSDGSAGVLEQGVDLLVRQVRDLLQVGLGSRGQALGGGVACAEFEDPGAGNVFDEQGEFGERERQQLVELVDEAGAMADDGLEPAGDLAQRAQFG